VVPDLQQRLQAALGDAFRLERELARGGMSRLFLATEASLNRQVVVKVLPPEFTSEISSDRFKQEIELAAHLQHPNLLPVLTAATRNELLYYITPYVAGESLRHRLTREGRLPIADATRVLHEIADALAYAHAEGVIHRDIKPENILLEGSHAVLTDFGVARAVMEARSGDRLTDTGLALGTPGYMAPEQAMGSRQVDARADVYALAVVGYEMFAGAPPFAGPTAQALIAAHLTATPRPLTDLRPEVAPEIAGAIARALAKDPEARLRTAAELRDAVGSSRAERVVSGRSRRSLLTLGAGVAAVIAVALGAVLLRNKAPTALDANLVAVAPFDVPDARLSLWHEGLVDILSRNLDGAGPIRSVPPTTVIRNWSGRADRPSASALGRSTGAQLVVFGSLIGTGPDSARLTATAFDVVDQRSLADIELRDAANRVDRLADSFTVRLLRELGRARRIEVFRTGSLGSTSLPALKAFLQGEQWFRRASWDSALASYQRAIAMDSMFPLALRRASQVLGWQHSAFDSVSTALALRAGALNHGLALRDSLLATADSLFAAAYTTIPRVDWSVIRRIHAVAQELTRRYPDDYESWYVLGEAHFHLGSAAGTTQRQALEAFDQAIANDSSFAPAYIHTVELALWLDGPEAASRYAKGYLKQKPTDASASGIALADRIMEAMRARPAEIPRLLQDASTSALIEAQPALRYAADSTEAAVQVARALAAAPVRDARWLSRDERERRLGGLLLYRGHVRQAVEMLYQNPASIPPQLVEAALLSPVLPDTAPAMFRRWLAGSWLGAGSALLPWYTARRDSTAIRELGRRSDSLARAARTEVERNVALYVSQAASAYLFLLRRDTATAVRRLEALPDTLCVVCYLHRLTLAQLLSARHEDAKAARLLDRQLVEIFVPSVVLWTLERARVADRMGDRDKAIRNYQYVAGIWRHADPELQPYVTEARQALARLTSEPRP
jgi:tetratricopeptide (TPR) repeat protein